MTKAAAAASEQRERGDAPTVAVLADDLIWATRLIDALSAAGATGIRVRRPEDLDRALGAGARHAIVDLTARAYDGVDAVRRAAGTAASVVAVGQHDDRQIRRAALEAGAARVYTYRALFEDGPNLLRAWLAREAGSPA